MFNAQCFNHIAQVLRTSLSLIVRYLSVAKVFSVTLMPFALSFLGAFNLLILNWFQPDAVPDVEFDWGTSGLKNPLESERTLTF